MWKLPILIATVTMALTIHGYPKNSCKTVTEILAAYGYLTTQYNLTTADGYKVTMFRVVGKNGRLDSTERKPLILQHGISASADNFVGNESNSPAMYFYDRGFDVWLPSARGTRYSPGHKDLSNESAAYWNFSFEEMGRYDTRAFVDLVYTETKQKVLYLGFSQGFMQMMAAFSLDPTFYQQRLAKIVGWAPVVRIDLTTHVGMVLAGELGVAKLGEWFGIKYLFGSDYDSCISSVKLCDSSYLLCKLQMLMSGDFAPYYDLDSGFSHSTDRTSYKDLMHLASNIYHKGFYRYPLADGSVEPYDLTRVTGVPIGLFIGQKDMLASVANGQWLRDTFRSTGTLAMYKEYQYLGHQTALLAKSRNDHVVDTADFLLAA